MDKGIARSMARKPAPVLAPSTVSFCTKNKGTPLRTIEEAVEIYRRLAKTQPAAFEPALARSLLVQELIAQER
jgi:hypothetical protein